MPQQKTMYLVADSAFFLPVEYLQSIPTVIAAYDNDDPGDELAKAIKELLPHATRARLQAKDWNSELLSRLHQTKNKKQKQSGLEQ